MCIFLQQFSKWYNSDGKHLKYFDSQGKHRKVEVIFRHIYCPPVPLLMGLAKGTTYPLNKLFCPLVILYFHILCFRCSGHKPHTILSPQMICLLNQVCVDGYEVKNRVICIMMQQSSTYSLILNFSNSVIIC